MFLDFSLANTVLHVDSSCVAVPTKFFRDQIILGELDQVFLAEMIVFPGRVGVLVALLPHHVDQTVADVKKLRLQLNFGFA